MTQFEGGYVGSAQDLVVGVHAAADAVGAGVFDFYLEEVFGWAIDLLEALLARIWYGLHCCKDWALERRQNRCGRQLFRAFSSSWCFPRNKVAAGEVCLPCEV